ncbi:DsrE family protein [Polynucleobacter sp. es-GGE-1]|jgi:intracellular sulfur oxidation DsrE/DsrF family protein|uniref:DsrE family protein n=1 Tax=unclassified Polynucleobacter TaxID=2640945 RepID=UPI001BFE46D0|nr:MULTISPECIES: DsrE family protein [unclassified Polynucleobacter]MBU3635283.1 DsrE family protein [Polynucleobacter sp. es-GGE-1]QWD69515.1 DsrE family protein [Polynucleobacter sp. UB-Siik-W21]
MKKILTLIFASLISIGFTSMAQAQSTGSTKVVYHIDDAEAQGLKGLRNIRNHLDVSPQTSIIVVTHANGVDLLMEGAKDKKNGTEYAPLVGALKSRGVKFEVCEITLKNRNLKKDQFTLDADFTPSGVVRVADLQYKDGFAYIKP